MHHSIYADSTYTLYRLGKKLLDTVSTSTSALLPDELIYAGSTGLTRCRQLFGEDEESTDELDEAEKQGENGELTYELCISPNPLLFRMLTRKPHSSPSPRN